MKCQMDKYNLFRWNAKQIIKNCVSTRIVLVTTIQFLNLSRFTSFFSF